MKNSNKGGTVPLSENTIVRNQILTCKTEGYTSFSKLLAAYMKENNKDAVKVAKKLGTGSIVITHWLEGSLPKPNYTERLAEMLGVHRFVVSWLIARQQPHATPLAFALRIYGNYNMISVMQLADDIGITYVSLNAIINHGGHLREGTIKKLSNLLGISEDRVSKLNQSSERNRLPVGIGLRTCGIT